MACAAPLFPPFSLAFSHSSNKLSNCFKFAAASSCTAIVLLAILSDAVPVDRTKF